MSAPLPFAVQPSSGVPIYRQIAEQVEALVAGGALREGDLLPSVRTVAETLAVNPMTVSKAYSQLESAGTVERLRGRGMQVAAVADSLAGRLQALRPQADELAAQARRLGLTQTQTLQAVREAYRASPPIETSESDRSNGSPRSEPRAASES